MHNLDCSFIAPDTTPRVCHSALTPIPDQVSTFRYKPLNRAKSEIRVLCPHCPAGSSINKYEFTVRTVSLDDKPLYWALSYVWGDTSDLEPICIEGQTFMATRNLREALKHVRNIMTTATMDLQLWVDAICINQTDATEKSWQVNIMARIYSQAHCLNVWLGLSDYNTTLAMELVSKIGSPSYNEKNPLTDEEFTAICQASIDLTLKKEGKESDDLIILWALEDIFHHRKYWKRAWTFQEFCLAPSVMWCGDSFVPLASALNFIARCGSMARRARITGSAFGDATPTVTKFIQCIEDIAYPLVERLKAGGFRKHAKEYSIEEHLGILLCQTMGRQASHPKDKVYSLLGLCNVQITPDYSDALSVGQLYRDTSAILLRRVKNEKLLTALLSCAGLCNQKDSRPIPSWAVDWDVVSKSQVNFKSAGNNLGTAIADTDGMASNKNFFAADLPVSISNLEFSFKAIIVDSVKEVYVPTFKHLMKPDGVGLLKFLLNDPPMEIFLPLIIRFHPVYKTGVLYLTAVLSTLLLGRDVVSKNDYERLFVNGRPCQNFRKCARIFLRVLNDVWKCTGGLTLSLERYLDQVLEITPEADAQRLEVIETRIDRTIDIMFGFEDGVLTSDDILEACSSIPPPADAINFYNKTPFGAHANEMSAIKTADRYIGACRAGVTPGDVICVLRDAHIPFILRPVGDKFALVSPCYIEGLMDGEAWGMVQAGDKSVQQITVI